MPAVFCFLQNGCNFGCLGNYNYSMATRTSSLEDHLGYWLRLLSNEVSSSFARRVESHGVSVAQWVVLRLLLDRKDCTLTELTAALEIDKGAVSRMIDRLIKLELVIRRESATSRREVALALTKKAEALVPILAHEADKNDLEFFSVLTARQQEEFLQTIRLLLASRTSLKPPLH